MDIGMRHATCGRPQRQASLVFWRYPAPGIALLCLLASHCALAVHAPRTSHAAADSHASQHDQCFGDRAAYARRRGSAGCECCVEGAVWRVGGMPEAGPSGHNWPDRRDCMTGPVPDEHRGIPPRGPRRRRRRGAAAPRSRLRSQVRAGLFIIASLLSA